MHSLADNLSRVRARMQAAARQAGRSADEVTLLGVSKKQPASAIRELVAAGLSRFGENYLQEALDKQAELADLEIEWHFIGPIQSNKTRAIASHFDWVHSVDRLKIAQRLSEQRPEHLPDLQICLQVNIDGEASKSGASERELAELVREVVALPRLQLRGLMAIPAPRQDYSAQLAVCRRLRELLEDCKTVPGAASLDTLSVGMSGDLEAAVAAGSTMVRVGTDLFGARE